MAAHRYWRLRNLRMTNTALNQMGITEIELRETAGGADVTGAGLGTAIGGGGHDAGTPPSAAFDNNTASSLVQWSSVTIANADGRYVGWDFGAGVTKDINEIVVWPNYGNAGRTFGLFTVDSSDDNSTWTTEWLCYYTGWVIGTPITFTKPALAAAKRYWMMRTITLQSNSALGLREMELRFNSVDQTAPGMAVFACTEFTPGLSAGYAIDNVLANLYSGSASARQNAEFIAVDLGSGADVDVDELYVVARNDSGLQTQAPATGQVLTSPDARSFRIVWAFTFSSFSSGEAKSSYRYTLGRRRQMVIAN